VAATNIAVFGGGCFWCTEAVLQQLKGVINVTPGYAGGNPPAGGRNPTYKEVSTGETGHAEVVKIEFDPAVITYRDLLTVFFASHDPTQLNRQGADVGTQYRSIILTTDDEQRQQAEEFLWDINTSEMEGDEVVTEIKPLEKFHEAEAEHKDFYNNNRLYPYSLAIISPKLKKVKKQFANLIREKL
jgi:peptide-methionine (S)-S-oxide reductase